MQTLLYLTESLQTSTAATDLANVDSTEAFPIACGVKQGCVLAPVSLSFFAVLLSQAFRLPSAKIYTSTLVCGWWCLYTVARLCVKTKVTFHLVSDHLCGDDAVFVSVTSKRAFKPGPDSGMWRSSVTLLHHKASCLSKGILTLHVELLASINLFFVFFIRGPQNSLSPKKCFRSVVGCSFPSVKMTIISIDVNISLFPNTVINNFYDYSY